MLALGFGLRFEDLHARDGLVRVDALFIPQAGEKTRPLNLVLGLAIAGYGAWSLWGG